MLIEVALTKEIINESLPVHYRQMSFFRRILSYLTPLMLLVYAVIITVLRLDYTEGWDRYYYLIGLSVVAVLYTLWITYRRNSLGGKTLKLMGDRTHYEIEATEEKLITRLSDATYEQKWTVYPKAVISKEIVLLYQQNKMYSIFHHSFFANDDFGRFKQWVRSRVHEVKED